MSILGLERVAVRMEQLTRHPEVNQENTTTFEPKNQILAAAVERRDPLSLELGGHSGGIVGPGEAWVEDLDVLETPAYELGLEPCPDGLDLWKLRHGRQRSAVGAAVALAQAMTSITTADSGGGSSART